MRLVADAETAGLNLSKDLTIGAGVVMRRRG